MLEPALFRRDIHLISGSLKVLIKEIMLSQELGAQMEQLIFGMSLIQPKFVKLIVLKLTLEL